MKKGTWNRHHYWFPKVKYEGTPEGDVIVRVHVHCHNQFHYHFLHYCLHDKRCGNCRYTDVCCFRRG
jgi:hypothetical protein